MKERIQRNKINAVTFVTAFALFLALSITTVWGGSMDGKIVILHSNDVHGAIDGYASIAALRADYEADGAKVIMADAGDYSQGDPYVSESKGATSIELMNMAGYDVATIGNHEFDYGQDALLTNLSNAQFTVLCCNVFRDGTPLPHTRANRLIEIDGVKIGFFGLETPETQTKANPALTQGVTFHGEQDMYSDAQAEVDALREQGADIVICLGHLGVNNSAYPNNSYELIRHVNGIDFLIDGHSHTVMTIGAENEAIQQTGTKFENVGVIVIDEHTKQIEKNELFELKDYTKKDPTVQARVDEIKREIDAKYSEVFARSLVTLNGAKAPNGNRDVETNNGDLITDAMLWSILKDNKTGIDEDHIVAIENGGGIRASITPGDVTRKDINTVLPFGNTVSVVYVTGNELLEALEASTFSTPDPVGGFPQMAGMEICIDTGQTYLANEDPYPNSTYYGPRKINCVTIRSVNGKSFDPSATYAVITNDFVAAGGDTYYAFAHASRQLDTGLALDEVLMAYIDEELKGVIGNEYAGPQGRISEYAFTEGMGAQWNDTSTEATDGLHFKTNGDLTKFTGITVDGKNVPKTAYTATSGSTILDLEPSYLESLSDGEHTLIANYRDGACKTVFQTTASGKSFGPAVPNGSGGSRGHAASTGSVRTGDALSVEIALFILLGASSATGLLVVMRRRRSE